MGSSTGNMLVDDEITLSEIFRNAPTLIATHCEDEKTIQKNIEAARNRYGENVPIEEHARIRSDEACYISSAKAVELASRHHARLHVLHLSSAKEMSLLLQEKYQAKKLQPKFVSTSVFDSTDYKQKGTDKMEPLCQIGKRQGSALGSAALR